MQDYLNESSTPKFGAKAALLAVAVHLIIGVGLYASRQGGKQENPTKPVVTEAKSKVQPGTAKPVSRYP